ncbi:MAG TPA: alpha/beta hydrolase [Ferruginibacter sp.]|nr:alpha/beta hydrolase [Ferruginibacter sp.]
MEKKLVFKNASLHYHVIGAGNVVVLLHGFGEDSSIWDELAAAISKNYLLIIPDIAGSGKSDLLTGNEIGMEEYAESIAAILQEENIKQCTMVGHSMGGYITLAFAEKYPQMLQAFGLFHSSAYADDETKKETRNKAIAFIKENGTQAFLKTSIPGLFMDAEKSKADINALLEKGKQFKPEALIQYYQAMIRRPDRIEVLKSFTKPVLFMLGTYDKAVLLEHGLQQSHLTSISYIHILSNSGHMGMMEEPEKSLLNFTHFLQGIYV